MKYTHEPVPFEEMTAGLPAVLVRRVRQDWRDYLTAAAQASVLPVQDTELLPVMFRVWACSDFVAQLCIREPDLLEELISSGDLSITYSPDVFAVRLGDALQPVHDEDALKRVLRRQRKREMLRIAWRDLAGWSALSETMRDLSLLADACLEGALQCLQGLMRKAYGSPCNDQGETQSLIVLGMGKLGGCELNFSSDVDLIFAYTEEGCSEGGARRLENSEYFTRLAQRLVDALHSITVDGFVFRVDTRLRPFGDSGPLTLSVDALEEYYQSHGREWERYAMIKARIVAGDSSAGERLLQRMRPFVYRRYLDYGVYSALREMKTLLERELHRKGSAGNIKLGAGGIREIEFIGQTFQLVRGGRLAVLQLRPIQRVLATLSEYGLLPEEAAAELNDAYVFLRNVEHRLQMVRDEQTHVLPVHDDDRLRLAWSMGFEDWQLFHASLQERMCCVHEHFRCLLFVDQAAQENSEYEDLTDVWQQRLARAPALEVLARAGFDCPGDAWRSISQLRDLYSVRLLSDRGRQRMDRLMPRLLAVVGTAQQPVLVLPRVLGLIESIVQRSAYLALLIENPAALSRLVELCSASPWIATMLARHPLLIDDVEQSLPFDRHMLQREMTSQFAVVAEGDLEVQMDVLRYFKQSNVLRVAVNDIQEKISSSTVSRYLTMIAEVILQQVLQLAWDSMVAKYGQPLDERANQGKKEAYRFVICAYGKFGGLELGYGSDLDLVFLHCSRSQHGLTAGPRKITNAQFFVRLGQRIIHILNAYTTAGVLYEVDSRLRPSGKSGLLINTLRSFRHYQLEEAWVWEHQALVRARIVAGDPEIAHGFQQIRQEVLQRVRDPRELSAEVCAMRERMRQELVNHSSGRFDLKQGSGGIVDIEFITQYAVLRWAQHYPDLTEHTDNAGILKVLASHGLLSDEDAGFLETTYRGYLSCVHRLTLQEQAALVDESEFRDARLRVQGIWRKVMGVDC